MPRGGGQSHRGKPRYKGRGKHYTTEGDREAEAEKERKEKEWRMKKGIADDEEEDGEGTEGAADAKKANKAEKSDEESESEEESSDEEADKSVAAEADAARDARRQPRAAAAKKSDSEDSDEDEGRKGVQHLIDIQNPNRAQKKMKKASDVSANDKVQLSRREREELEKQKAKARYEKLHLAGKTDEARADLARLALVRKQREEAAVKRKVEDKKKAADGSKR